MIHGKDQSFRVGFIQNRLNYMSEVIKLSKLKPINYFTVSSKDKYDEKNRFYHFCIRS